MPVITADNRAQVVYRAGMGPGIIANLDTVNTVYMADNPGINGLSDPLPPQANVPVDGSADVYVATLSQGITVEVSAIRGATAYNNPVGVQIALNALGLAKDSSVNNPAFGPAKDSSVNAPSYGPAKDSSLTTINTSVNGPSYGPAKDVSVTALHAGGQTIAAEVSTTGAPLLTASTLLQSRTGSTLGAGLSSSTAKINLTQPGYELWLSLSAGASSTLPTMTVQLDWFDTNTGNILESQQYNLWQGGPCTYLIRGPSHANQLQITFTNLDTVTATYSDVLLGNSRFYEDDVIIPRGFTAIPGQTLPNVNTEAGYLCSTAPTIAASATAVRALPVYSGDVSIVIDNLAQANGLTVIVEEFQDPTVTGGIVFATGIGLGQQLNQIFKMPRDGCQLTLKNQGSSGSITPNVGIVAIP